TNAPGAEPRQRRSRRSETTLSQLSSRSSNMNSKSEREKSENPRPVDDRTPKKRFRIVKLEERIAPGGGGNGSNATCGNIATCHHCVGGSSATDSGSIVSVF